MNKDERTDIKVKDEIVRTWTLAQNTRRFWGRSRPLSNWQSRKRSIAWIFPYLNLSSSKWLKLCFALNSWRRRAHGRKSSKQTISITILSETPFCTFLENGLSLQERYLSFSTESSMFWKDYCLASLFSGTKRPRQVFRLDLFTSTQFTCSFNGKFLISFGSSWVSSWTILRQSRRISMFCSVVGSDCIWFCWKEARLMSSASEETSSRDFKRWNCQNSDSIHCRSFTIR